MEKISNTLNGTLPGNTYNINCVELERNDQSTYSGILQAFRRMFSTIDYNSIFR